MLCGMHVSLETIVPAPQVVQGGALLPQPPQVGAMTAATLKMKNNVFLMSANVFLMVRPPLKRIAPNAMGQV